jgi:hypothetical protein
MINWVKNFFTKKEKKDTMNIEEYKSFLYDKETEIDDKLEDYFINLDKKFYLSDKEILKNNKFFTELKDFDKNKPSILIIDDNDGIISFLIDDLNEIFTEEEFKKYNLITFSGSQAFYNFKITQEYYQGLNIKYALIDLTYGGIVNTKKGIIKANGVDVYVNIKNYEKDDFKFLFYTGNSLNEHVRTNRQMIDKFKIYSNGENMIEYVLFKTVFNIEERRNILRKWFNGEKIDLKGKYNENNK